MSSQSPHYSFEDIEHLSSGFQRMGCEYTYSQGSSHNGWDDDTDDLKEEDVWGGHDTSGHWKNSYTGGGYDMDRYCDDVHGGVSAESNGYVNALENGHTSKKKGKGLKSRLSMELQAAGLKGHKKGHTGVGFADLDAVQNDGYGGGTYASNGWAPGFSVRKVKIPFVGTGGGDNGYANSWHDYDLRGNRSGVPQSAPVSMPVWPVNCGYGDTNEYADADDGSPKGSGVDDQNSIKSENDDDDDDDDDGGTYNDRRRLAPHEIVDREYARSRSTTFSVIEGAGRTLKGSDLRRVRNAVWSCTGFED